MVCFSVFWQYDFFWDESCLRVFLILEFLLYRVNVEVLEFYKYLFEYIWQFEYVENLNSSAPSHIQNTLLFLSLTLDADWTVLSLLSLGIGVYRTSRPVSGLISEKSCPVSGRTFDGISPDKNLSK